MSENVLQFLETTMRGFFDFNQVCEGPLRYDASNPPAGKWLQADDWLRASYG
jgi:hypothetical protein